MKQSSLLGAGRAMAGWGRTAMLVLLGSAAVAVGDLDAQGRRGTVLVHEEPRHRLIHEEGDLKLLDVQILPGDTTLNHTHVSPIMYTFISSGQGSSNGRVSANVDYANEHYTHWVTNDGPNLFRIIALAHYGDAVANVEANRPDGLSVDPQLENGWFRSYRLELAPGEETPVLRHRNPAVIVQVTDGHTQVTREKGFGADLDGMGDWTWRDPETSYRIRNAGTTPVSIVVNEGRQGR